MKKETFVKLITAYVKVQEELRDIYNIPIACGSFIEDILHILDSECEFYWWYTQKPKVAYYCDVEYPIKTPEEFWEYTQICNYEKEVFEGISKGLKQVAEGKIIKAGKGKKLDKFFESLK